MSARKTACDEELLPSLPKESMLLGESASQAGSASTSRSQRAARRAALKVQAELAAQQHQMELLSLEETRQRRAKADEARARMAAEQQAEERRLQEEEDEAVLRRKYQMTQFQLQAEQSVLEAEEQAITLVEEEEQGAQSRQRADLVVGPEPTQRHPAEVKPAAVIMEGRGAWNRQRADLAVGSEPTLRRPIDERSQPWMPDKRPAVEKWLQESHGPVNDHLQVIQRQHSELVGVLQAPKVEMAKFNGDPLQYAPFMRAFEESVEKVVSSNAARLTRLANLCEGEAAKAIACLCRQTGDIRGLENS